MSRKRKQPKAAAHTLAYRARRRAQGYVRKEFWVRSKDWPTVKAYLLKYAPGCPDG